MKLRIQGNSIRFRLTKAEVERFEKQGMVGESMEISDDAGSAFRYSLEKCVAPGLNAKFENGKLTVFVSNDLADAWARSDQVGIEGEAGYLCLLVEKDLGCRTHRTGKDETDNYAYPDA